MKFFLTCLGISIFLFSVNYKLHSDRVDSRTKSPIIGQVHEIGQAYSPKKVGVSCGRHYVVCRGVPSIAQYNQVMRADATVRKLYSVMGPVQITTLDNSEFAYDSYRVGNSIYWTKKTKFIPAGEPVISDGKWAILMRCGNLIALDPQYPITDSPEPQDLYPPPPVYVVDAPPEVPYAPPPPFLVVDTPEPAAPHTPETVPGTPSIYASYVPPTFPPSEETILTSQPPKESFPVSPAFPGTPVNTPEPSSFEMLFLGLVGIGVWQGRRN
jgi:PEP-CTERM motif